MFEPTDLESFLSVAQTYDFTEAGRRLVVWFRQPLFSRTKVGRRGGRLAKTEVGRIFRRTWRAPRLSAGG
jgi:hypothetical protein